MIYTQSQWENLINNSIFNNSALIPSPPDERDYPLQTFLGEVIPFPDKASLRKYVPYILNQEKSPLCAAYSIANIINSYLNMVGKLPPGGVSPRFIYWQAKKIDGLKPGTVGTTLRAVLQVVHKIGVCPESMCPSLPDWSEPKFTDEIMEEAAKYKIKGYARLNVGTLEEIQRAIANGRMVLTGSLITAGNWADGWIIQPEGNILGGHATFDNEYDKNLTFEEKGKIYKNFVGGVNSWSTKWGLNGCYNMAEHYAQFKYVDLGNIPALMEAWSVEFDIPFEPSYGPTKKEFDVAPIIINGRTMVELRSLVKLADVKNIDWNEKEQKVTLQYANKTVVLYIGKKEYTIE